MTKSNPVENGRSKGKVGGKHYSYTICNINAMIVSSSHNPLLKSAVIFF